MNKTELNFKETVGQNSESCKLLKMNRGQIISVLLKDRRSWNYRKQLGMCCHRNTRIAKATIYRKLNFCCNKQITDFFLQEIWRDHCWLWISGTTCPLGPRPFLPSYYQFSLCSFTFKHNINIRYREKSLLYMKVYPFI